MNLNENPTLEQFRELLCQHDDHAGHHVLWVRKDGEVVLTCLPKSNPRQELPTHEDADMQLRYGTFPVGYGYVGPLQPEDDGWFRGEMFRHLLDLWPKLKGAPGVTHFKLGAVAPQGRVVDAEEAAWHRCQREEFLRCKQAGESEPRCRPAQ